MSEKFPKIPHLTFSPNIHNDDHVLKDLSGLLSKPYVILEKMDGSNACLTNEAVYSRSHSSEAPHPSFDGLKQFHACIKHLIPENVSLFGEWCYAYHSIEYDKLPWPPFFLFGVRDDSKNIWHSWYGVQTWANVIDVCTVPYLHTEKNDLSELNLQANIKKLNKLFEFYATHSKEHEGFVVRKENHFTNDEFSKCVAKWVRKNHVQSDEHWSKNWRPHKCLKRKKK